MTNQLSKFIPSSDELMKPLIELLSSKHTFQWGLNQIEAFDKIKKKLTTPLILALHGPAANTKMSGDVMHPFSIGYSTENREQLSRRLVTFASRTMTDTEVCYAQIVKEAFDLTWACERVQCIYLKNHLS